MLSQLAASQQGYYERCEKAIAAWLEAKGVTLDKRQAKRMWQRTFVKMGADFPWERIMDARWEPYMERHLEWAQGKSRW